MKTQPISSQSFTAGKIVFVNRHFVIKPFDKISEYLPAKLGNEIETASKKLENKDYDVFVYRKRDNINWFEVRAGKSYFSKTNKKPVYIHENMLKSCFLDAVSSAIEAYENAVKIIK